ncbi:MAG: glycosyltransferase [Deltaproteobacteria bacterium]|nr:glycosyltransferase [Deltaproteobacteria bacterium]
MTLKNEPALRRHFIDKRIAYWNARAGAVAETEGWSQYYHRCLQRIYQRIVPRHQRVLEVGCGQGGLLAALEPADGTGVDLCEEMIKRGSDRFPQLRFIHSDAQDLELEETFDFIIMSDLVNELWDVQEVLGKLRRFCDPHTRIILNSYSRVWQPVLATANALGVAKPVLDKNWLAPNDIANLFHLEGFEIIRKWAEVLWPLNTPFLAELCNRMLVRLWPLRLFALTGFIIARPQPHYEVNESEPTVSVVVPARNEAGNIKQLFERTPEMGAGTELVFVEGQSSDNTYETIREAMAAHPERKCQLFRQPGTGKGDAVRHGFAHSSGDVLMILDGDISVPPEILPRFYEALVSGKGEFINGVRLVYPMEQRAMRFFNQMGNKFFSLAFTWLLEQPIKDCLCGTKVLYKKHYQVIAANRAYFGNLDPFGDFDLILGAARLNLKIVDVPIRYQERTYGSTNIRRWRHGVLLFRMLIVAARRLKFA